LNRSDLKNRIIMISNRLIADKGYICSIDVLCELKILSETQVKDWRFGKTPYLEKSCSKNLGALTFINSTIKEFANDKNLKHSWTAYNKYGKGVKSRLVFSKTKIEKIENAHATHYLDTERIKALKRERASL